MEMSRSLFILTAASRCRASLTERQSAHTFSPCWRETREPFPNPTAPRYVWGFIDRLVHNYWWVLALCNSVKSCLNARIWKDSFQIFAMQTLGSSVRPFGCNSLQNPAQYRLWRVTTEDRLFECNTCKILLSTGLMRYNRRQAFWHFNQTTWQRVS